MRSCIAKKSFRIAPATARNSFGLAPIDVAADPTLRPGDIVASGDNVKAALIAMHASKERAAAREAASERPALRGASRRAAVAPQRTDAPPAEPEERPED